MPVLPLVFSVDLTALQEDVQRLRIESNLPLLTLQQRLGTGHAKYASRKMKHGVALGSPGRVRVNNE